MDSQHPDWAALPEDLLDVIINKLLSLFDYLQFSVVCKSWYSIALHNKQERFKITSNVVQLPLLIVPPIDCGEGKRGLYDIRKNTICNHQLEILYKKRCCGSSHGWLFMVEETIDITLVNPFSHKVIHLPPLTRDVPEIAEDDLLPYDYQCHIYKAILTKNPLLHPNDYVVVAIYGDIRRLAIIKANDESWTYLDPIGRRCFEDVNVHKDTIYALDHLLGLWEVDVSEDHENPTSYLKMVTPRIQPSLEHPYYSHDTLVYLVENFSKELLLVQRFIKLYGGNGEPIDSETRNFEVYGLSNVCEDGMRKHVKIVNLGSGAIFLGDNQTIWVSTEEFSSCMPNCIYFTDNNHIYPTPFKYGPRDAGIFNLGDGSLDKHYITNPAHKDMPPPIWIIPTLL